MHCPCCGKKIKTSYFIKSIFKLYCNLNCPCCSSKLCVNKAQFTLYILLISSINIFCLVDWTIPIKYVLVDLIKVFLITIIIFLIVAPTLKLKKIETKLTE